MVRSGPAREFHAGPGPPTPRAAEDRRGTASALVRPRVPGSVDCAAALAQTRADSLRPMELGLTMGPGIGLSELVASLGTSHHRCVDAGGVAQGQDDAPWRRMGIRMLLCGPDSMGLLSDRGWPRRCPQEGSRRGEPRSSRRAGCPNSIHWSGPEAGERAQEAAELVRDRGQSVASRLRVDPLSLSNL